MEPILIWRQGPIAPAVPLMALCAINRALIGETPPSSDSSRAQRVDVSAQAEVNHPVGYRVGAPAGRPALLYLR